MKKKMSTFEKVFREEGKAEGKDKTVLEFIQDKRDYHVTAPDTGRTAEILQNGRSHGKTIPST